MSSLTRISATLRLLMIEISLPMYLISTLLYLCFLLFALMIGMSAGFVDSVRQGLAEVPTEAVKISFSNAVLIGMIVLTGKYVGQWFKHDDRATVLLTLPLHRGERFATVLIFAWVVVPLLAIVPPTLLTLLAYAVAPQWIILPQLWPILNQVVPIFFLVHIGLSCLYLLPMIAFPKKIGLGVVIFVAAIWGYIYITREALTNETQVELVNNPYEDKDVVGMYDQGVLTSAAPPRSLPFRPPDDDKPPTTILILCGVALVAAAGVKLNEKMV